MKFRFMVYITGLLCALREIKGGSVKGRLGRTKLSYVPGIVRLESNGKFQCEGALIEERWVLASARCANRDVDTVILVRCSSNKKGANCETKMPIDRVIMHHSWDGLINNDLALITLTKSAKKFRTIRLSNAHQDSRKPTKCYTIEWKKAKEAMEQQMINVRWQACERKMADIEIEDPLCSVTKQSDCELQKADGNPTICYIGNKRYLFGLHAVSKQIGSRCFNGLTRVGIYQPWFRNVMETLDQTDIRIGGRCVPHTTDPCQDKHATCLPNIYSHTCQCIYAYKRRYQACAPMENQPIGRMCSTSAKSPCLDPYATCVDANDDGALVCACNPGYLDSADNVCERTGSGLADGCNLNDIFPCKDPLAECKYDGAKMMCTCIDDHFIRNGLCIAINEKQLLGEVCLLSFTSPCLDPYASCLDDNGVLVCQCDPGYVVNAQYACEKTGADLGEQCNLNDIFPCKDPLTECKDDGANMVCTCTENYFFKDGVCTAITENQPLGEVCLLSFTSPCLDPYASCLDDNGVLVCQCDPGYVVNAQNVCEKTGADLGEQCNLNDIFPCKDPLTECKDDGANMVCMCIENYFVKDGVCTAITENQPLGEVCLQSFTSPCLDPYASCLDDNGVLVCQCDPGYVVNDENACEQTGADLGEQCNLNDIFPCKDPLTECKDDGANMVCTCIENYFVKDGVCKVGEESGSYGNDNRKLGETCSISAASPCLDPNANCVDVNGTLVCQCGAAYFVNAEKACEKSGAILGEQCNVNDDFPCKDSLSGCVDVDGSMVCACIENHYDKDDVCIVIRENQTLGEECLLTFTSPCLDPYANCVDDNGTSVCQCEQAYFVNAENACEQSGADLGEECNLPDIFPCKDPLTECVDVDGIMECACIATYYNKDGVCAIITENQPLGEACLLSFSSPCADPNASCVDDDVLLVCQCDAAYFVNAENVCEQSGATIGEECNMTDVYPCKDSLTECVDVDGLLECACIATYYNKNSSCTDLLEMVDFDAGEKEMRGAISSAITDNQPLGEACLLSFTSPCVDPNASCVDVDGTLVCQCGARYFVNAENICEKSGSNLGEECNVDDVYPCKDPLTECVDIGGTMKCACVMNYYNKEGVCTVINEHRPIGEVCSLSFSSPCLDSNASCVAVDGTLVCQCGARYFANADNACEQSGASLGGECNLNETFPCKDPFTECVDDDGTMKCACIETFYDKGGICVYKEHGVGEYCFDDSDCTADTTCTFLSGSPGRICMCRVGYSLDLTNRACSKCQDGYTSMVSTTCYPKLLAGSNCQHETNSDACAGDLVCRPAIGSSTYTCQCERTHRQDAHNSTACVLCPSGQQQDATGTGCEQVTLKQVGDVCIESVQCPEFSACDSGTCSCLTGYVLIDDKCLPVSNDPLAKCIANEQCLSPMECVDGFCQCQSGYTAYFGRCLQNCDNDQPACYNNGRVCPTPCDGVSECSPQVVNLGFTEFDEYCDMDYASHCLFDVQCDASLGLICGPVNQCTCSAGLNWNRTNGNCTDTN